MPVIKTYWPETLLILIELGLSVLHFVERFEHVFPNPHTAFLAIATIQFLVLVAYVGVRLGHLSEFVKEQYAHLRETLKSVTQVQHLRSSEFYNDFAFAVLNAHNAVAITHLDSRPPTRQPKSREADYYAELRNIIALSRARFRRVEYASAGKIDWIGELIDSYTGCPNFSLSLIRAGTLTADANKSVAVSVQVVDDHTTYLVDVARQLSEHKPRDIKIIDATFTDKWRAYYDDVLWSRAVHVLENGVLVNHDWRLLCEAAK